MLSLEELSSAELLSRFAAAVVAVERAVECGASEARERELMVAREEVAEALLARLVASRRREGE